MSKLVLAVSVLLIISLAGINAAGSSFYSNEQRTSGRDDLERRSGLGQDSSRKTGYSSKRKDVSKNNAPRNPGIDKSQRTSGAKHKPDTRHKERREAKKKRIRREREKMKRKDIMNNPFSPYKK